MQAKEILIQDDLKSFNQRTLDPAMHTKLYTIAKLDLVTSTTVIVSDMLKHINSLPVTNREVHNKMFSSALINLFKVQVLTNDTYLNFDKLDATLSFYTKENKINLDYLLKSKTTTDFNLIMHMYDNTGATMDHILTVQAIVLRDLLVYYGLQYEDVLDYIIAHKQKLSTPTAEPSTIFTILKDTQGQYIGLQYAKHLSTTGDRLKDFYYISKHLPSTLDKRDYAQLCEGDYIISFIHEGDLVHIDDYAVAESIDVSIYKPVYHHNSINNLEQYLDALYLIITDNGNTNTFEPD
jgi:hypothetical protein